MPFDHTALNLDGELRGKVLCVGVDTLSETFDVKVHPKTLELLELQKLDAEEGDYDGPQSFRFGDETALLGKPARGMKFFVRCEGFDVQIRHVPDWRITVRYASTGIWQSGIPLLRDRALSLLAKIGHVPQQQLDAGEIVDAPARDWQRVSDVHVCVDIFSTEITEIMVPGIEHQLVMAARVKYAPYGADGKHQTLTIGLRPGVQVSIYDKGREIREASGKTWFKEIWERSGQKIESFENIWRVEVRLPGDWLKDRACYTWDDFQADSVRLLLDALWTRRLTHPTGDTNKARWPLHWLWRTAMLAMCGEVVAAPLGLRLQRDSEALPQTLKRTAAGVIRAAGIAEKCLNPVDRRSVDQIMRDVVRDVQALMFQDPEHEKKKARIGERYRKIANPR